MRMRARRCRGRSGARICGHREERAKAVGSGNDGVADRAGQASSTSTSCNRGPSFLPGDPSLLPKLGRLLIGSFVQNRRAFESCGATYRILIVAGGH